MKFYHGTSIHKIIEIQKEGVLWGDRSPRNPDGTICKKFKADRCTYLATDIAEAMCYGDVVLEVEYTPDNENDNYTDNCWQFRVYNPIPLEDVRVVIGWTAKYKIIRQQAIDRTVKWLENYACDFINDTTDALDLVEMIKSFKKSFEI